MSKTPLTPILTFQQAAFMQEGVSINVAGRNHENRASVCRAFGCKIDDGYRNVVVFIYPALSEPFLTHLSEGSSIAVVFSKPGSHETIQVKASAAELTPLEPGDIDVMASYYTAMEKGLGKIGFPSSFTRSMIPEQYSAAVGLRFIPEALYSQTPGPGAGVQISTK